MNAFLEIFGNTTVSTICMFIVAGIFVFNFGKKIYKSITSVHDSLQEREELIKKTLDDVVELKENDKRMDELLNSINQKQIVLEELSYQKTEEEKSRHLNQIRNQLVKMYKFYKEQGYWNEFEKDAYFKIYYDYKGLGGNGYVENTIKPELELLEVNCIR